MPHKKIFKKFKSGIAEVREGLPLARARLKTLASKKRRSTEQKDLQIVRDIQKERFKKTKRDVGAADIKFREMFKKKK